MILCRSGRGIAEIIRHLTHLTATGWCVFIGIVLCAILLTIFSRKILSRVMIAKAKIQFPEFQWVAMPKIGGKLSLVIFCILFSFLGYFSPISDDISFFRYMGLGCAVLYSISFFLPVNQSCAILCNKNELYLAKYSGFGVFKPVKRMANLIAIEEDSNDEKMWIIKYGDKENKTFGRIYPSQFTSEGSAKIELFLKQPNVIMN